MEKDSRHLTSTPHICTRAHVYVYACIQTSPQDPFKKGNRSLTLRSLGKSGSFSYLSSRSSASKVGFC